MNKTTSIQVIVAMKNIVLLSLFLSIAGLLSACSGMANKSQIQLSTEEIEWHSETKVFDKKAQQSLTLWLIKYPARDIRIKLDETSNNHKMIKTHLISQGIRPQQIELFTHTAILPSHHNFIAALVIRRSIPKCPSWITPNMADSNVRQSSNFGCASERNLAIMIADPADLIRGKKLDGASAEHSINALDRYYRRIEDQAGPTVNPEPLEAPSFTN